MTTVMCWIGTPTQGYNYPACMDTVSKLRDKARRKGRGLNIPSFSRRDHKPTPSQSPGYGRRDVFGRRRHHNTTDERNH